MGRTAIKYDGCWFNPFRCDGWLRWRIARWFERHEDACWADLVLWVLYEPFWELGQRLDRGGECRKEAAEVGWCYCGKFITKEHAEHFNDSIIVDE